MKKFAANVNRELRKAYPDRRKLESQCISAIAFVKDNQDILDCSCWVMIINIVALDMLRSKLPPGKWIYLHNIGLPHLQLVQWMQLLVNKITYVDGASILNAQIV